MVRYSSAYTSTTATTTSCSRWSTRTASTERSTIQHDCRRHRRGQSRSVRHPVQPEDKCDVCIAGRTPACHGWTSIHVETAPCQSKDELQRIFAKRIGAVMFQTGSSHV